MTESEWQSCSDLANVVNRLPVPEVPDIDTDGLMVPPWVRFPNLPTASMKWWMTRSEACEAYRDQYGIWWSCQPSERRRLVRERYPAPPEWDEFYFVMSVTAGLEPKVRRIRELIGALSNAFWQTMEQRKNAPGFSPLEYLYAHYEELLVETDEEIAIWNELTKPQNYQALLRHAEHCKESPVNDYVARLSAALLKIAAERLDSGLANRPDC